MAIAPESGKKCFSGSPAFQPDPKVPVYPVELFRKFEGLPALQDSFLDFILVFSGQKVSVTIPCKSESTFDRSQLLDHRCQVRRRSGKCGGSRESVLSDPIVLSLDECVVAAKNLQIDGVSRDVSCKNPDMGPIQHLGRSGSVTADRRKQRSSIYVELLEAWIERGRQHQFKEKRWMLADGNRVESRVAITPEDHPVHPGREMAKAPDLYKAGTDGLLGGGGKLDHARIEGGQLRATPEGQDYKREKCQNFSHFGALPSSVGWFMIG